MTGSDHFPIRLEVTSPHIETVEFPMAPRYNLNQIDWSIFDETLTSTLEAIRHKWDLLIAYSHRTSNLNTAAQAITTALQRAIEESAPHIQIFPRSKTWWNDDIREHRRIMK